MGTSFAARRSPRNPSLDRGYLQRGPARISRAVLSHMNLTVMKRFLLFSAAVVLSLAGARPAEAQSPAPERTAEVVDAALQRGLLLLKAGVYGNCIRVLCPLTTSDGELDEGLDVWEEALIAVLG